MQAVSEAQAYIFEERDRLLALQADNENLRRQEHQDRRRIEQLLALTSSARHHFKPGMRPALTARALDLSRSTLRPGVCGGARHHFNPGGASPVLTEVYIPAAGGNHVVGITWGLQITRASASIQQAILALRSSFASPAWAVTVEAPNPADSAPKLWHEACSRYVHHFRSGGRIQSREHVTHACTGAAKARRAEGGAQPAQPPAAEGEAVALQAHVALLQSQLEQQARPPDTLPSKTRCTGVCLGMASWSTCLWTMARPKFRFPAAVTTPRMRFRRAWGAAGPADAAGRVLLQVQIQWTGQTSFGWGASHACVDCCLDA